MRSIILIATALLLAGCANTILVPEPVAYHPPAILMQPPHTNKTIETVVKETPK